MSDWKARPLLCIRYGGLVELAANGDTNKRKIGDFKDPVYVTIAGNPVRQ